MFTGVKNSTNKSMWLIT